MWRRWSLALFTTVAVASPSLLHAQTTMSESRPSVGTPIPVRAAEESLDAETALLRGLVVPGLGQFYAGTPALGAGYLGATTTAVLIGLLSQRVEIQCLSPLQDGGCPSGMEFSRHERRHLMGQSLLAAGAIAVAGAVHAWIDVRGRNNPGGGSVTSQREAAVGVGLMNAEWAVDRVRVGLVNVRF
jgi:hypothetical protein